MIYNLAAYSVYRELYGNNKFKNTKEVLKLFISYVLEQKDIICFSVADIQKELYDVFEFDIPLLVIKSVLKYLINDGNIVFEKINILGKRRI